jgi:hypothetical protein
MFVWDVELSMGHGTGREREGARPVTFVQKSKGAGAHYVSNFKTDRVVLEVFHTHFDPDAKAKNALSLFAVPPQFSMA